MIAGLLLEREAAGGKSGLRIVSARKSVGEQGNAPGNARGLRVVAGEGSQRRRGYGKCHRKANRR
jgi:hypothetical protein